MFAKVFVKSVRSAFLIGSENEMVMFCVLAMVEFFAGENAVIRGGPALVGERVFTYACRLSTSACVMVPL